MSSAGDSRSAILAGLEAAGVRTAITAKLSAPCVHVEPGDPWSPWVRMPGRVYAWRLTAIAGRADSAGALETLGQLVDAVDAGLRTVPGCQMPSWSKPADYVIDGVPYAGTVATITYASA